jgi:hypothetical protein
LAAACASSTGIATLGFQLSNSSRPKFQVWTLNLVSYHPRTVEYVQGRKKQFSIIHFLHESPYIPVDSVVAEQPLVTDYRSSITAAR